MCHSKMRRHDGFTKHFVIVYFEGLAIRLPRRQQVVMKLRWETYSIGFVVWVSGPLWLKLGKIQVVKELTGPRHAQVLIILRLMECEQHLFHFVSVKFDRNIHKVEV